MAAISKVTYAGSTLIDLTNDTVVPSSLLKGATAHRANGDAITGTLDPSPTLQSKTVTPSETEQTASPDNGYDGLSSVKVEAIPSSYIGSGISKKAAQTYTPRATAQTIPAGQYLSGAQTIAGDTNLVAGNIKRGTSIFGVAGTYEGSVSVKFYTGTDAPAASVGNEGDWYLQTEEA